MIPIVVSLIGIQFLEILKKNTLEMVVLNGLVFSYLTAEQILITTSKSQKIMFHFDSFLYMIVVIFSLFFSYDTQIVIFTTYAVVTLLRYLRYIFSVTKQLLFFLNIDF